MTPEACYREAEEAERRGDFAAMAQWLDLSGVAPGRDDDRFDYASHCTWADEFRAKQSEAIGHGIPAIYLNALPNSGSSFLCAFLTRVLNVERCRTSKGLFMTARIVPSWLEAFSRGGATTHEHFLATPANIATLESSGIARIIVHVRHPLAVMASMARKLQAADDDLLRLSFRYTDPGVPPAYFRGGMACMTRSLFPSVTAFLETWMRYAATKQIELIITRYEDMVDDAALFGERLLGHYGIDCSAAAPLMAILSQEARAGQHNFHGGESTADDLDDESMAIATSLLKPEILEFYGYQV